MSRTFVHVVFNPEERPFKEILKEETSNSCLTLFRVVPVTRFEWVAVFEYLGGQE